jgi:hypothetical protein
MDTPVASYDELKAMDDATFLKAVKVQQEETAKSIEDEKAKSSVTLAMYTELKAFDEAAHLRIAELESKISAERTVIEKKYSEQLATVKG